MNRIYDNWSMWKKLLTMLEHQFGNRTEFILHDLTKDYNHTIVDIRNGHITHRKIGDCGSNLGLEVLRGSVKDGDRYNYIVNTRDGKLLRSSTMYIHNDDGTVIGTLCINTDITETVRFEEYLRQYNQYSTSVPTPTEPIEPARTPAPAPPPAQTHQHEPEFFATNVTELLDYLIADATRLIGKPVDQMQREDKIEFVRYLDGKGAFLITHSAEKVYEYLNISRFTLYNYLDLVRKDSDKSEKDNGEKNTSDKPS